ncbi:inositol-trisphosphate 3-kinase homolog isoform X2 [Tetranychus urticae]|uniref:Kinase n=1 Tax=Tetranychus urticae TaxID=32264 RepID=T1KDZ7_TETUR|nr:inositol-trisphosphate 3-kinase homolog isoform X2 [Tetranychus urticae]
MKLFHHSTPNEHPHQKDKTAVFPYQLDTSIAPSTKGKSDKLVDCWLNMAPTILISPTNQDDGNNFVSNDISESVNPLSPNKSNLSSDNTLMIINTDTNNINNNNNNNINSFNKTRKTNWIQLSGHENTFAFGSPGILYKKCKSDGNEALAYKSLMEEATMKPFVPNFYGCLTVNGSCCIAIDNLLYHFDNPYIMDIKMGSRTFLEDEVSNGEPRADLYEKMIKLDPSALSEAEKQVKAITKLKYMQLREQLSSSSTLGFRIEAFKTNLHRTKAKDLSFVKTREQVKEVLRQFLPADRDQFNKILDRLNLIQSSFKCSSFFQSHEVVGSSLLMVYDSCKVGIWMIDFAKTVPLPEGITIDHVSPWVQGNHEDGYLFGLENLINVIKEF